LRPSDVRYLTDECVAGSIVKRLREDGFDIVRAVEVGATEDDDQVLARALQDGRVLITSDKDFGELVVRLGRPTIGVVNLALGELGSAARAEIAASRLHELGDRVLGNLVTIEPGRVRMRPLPRQPD
jgi:predicted nuclease of predicted toxin-antitoxin system